MDKPTLPPPPAVPLMQAPPTFTPITIANFPPPPAPAGPAESQEKLTNENLLKSIGFIPGSQSKDEKPEAAGVTSVGGDDPLMASSSTDQLLRTFEVVSDPSSVPCPLEGGANENEEEDDEDFVVIVPDCFDLTKPLPEFSPSNSLSYVVDDSSYDLPSAPEVPDPAPRSCDSHVSILMASQTSQSGLSSAGELAQYSPMSYSTKHISPGGNEKDSGTEGDFSPVFYSKEGVVRSPPVPPPPSGYSEVSSPSGAELPDSDSKDEGAEGDASPASAQKAPNLAPRFNMRTIKGGLYRNPLAMATGFVNAVSEFVDDKVHFAPPGGEKKPAVQFADLSSDETTDDEDEDFHVRNIHWDLGPYLGCCPLELSLFGILSLGTFLVWDVVPWELSLFGMLSFIQRLQ